MKIRPWFTHTYTRVCVCSGTVALLSANSCSLLLQRTGSPDKLSSEHAIQPNSFSYLSLNIQPVYANFIGSGASRQHYTCDIICGWHCIWLVSKMKLAAVKDKLLEAFGQRHFLNCETGGREWKWSWTHWTLNYILSLKFRVPNSRVQGVFVELRGVLGLGPARAGFGVSSELCSALGAGGTGGS